MKLDSRIQFVPDPAGFNNFKSSPTGPVGTYIRNRGRRLVAMSKADAPKDTGALATSIGMTYVPAPNPWVVVGSHLNYALAVHEGTPPHVITPRTGRMLRFKVQGKVVYARKTVHPGTRPNRYLTRHLRKVVND